MPACELCSVKVDRDGQRCEKHRHTSKIKRGKLICGELTMRKTHCHFSVARSNMRCRFHRFESGRQRFCGAETKRHTHCRKLVSERGMRCSDHYGIEFEEEEEILSTDDELEDNYLQEMETYYQTPNVTQRREPEMETYYQTPNVTQRRETTFFKKGCTELWKCWDEDGLYMFVLTSPCDKLSALWDDDLSASCSYSNLALDFSFTGNDNFTDVLILHKNQKNAVWWNIATPLPFDPFLVFVENQDRLKIVINRTSIPEFRIVVKPLIYITVKCPRNAFEYWTLTSSTPEPNRMYPNVKPDLVLYSSVKSNNVLTEFDRPRTFQEVISYLLDEDVLKDTFDNLKFESYKSKTGSVLCIKSSRETVIGTPTGLQRITLGKKEFGTIFIDGEDVVVGYYEKDKLFKLDYDTSTSIKVFGFPTLFDYETHPAVKQFL